MSTNLTELERLHLECDALEAELVLVRRRVEAAELAFQATGDISRDWDLQYDQLTWGGDLEAAYGYPLSAVEPTVAWWLLHIHPDDRARVEAGLRTLIASTGTSWLAEYRFRAADDGFRHVRERGTVQRGEAGQALRMICAMTDLTGHGAAEHGSTAAIASVAATATAAAQAEPAQAPDAVPSTALALLQLGDQLGDAVEPGAIILAVGNTLGAMLGLVRVAYAEWAPDGEALTVPSDWTAVGMASIAGRLPRETFGEEILATLLAGQIVAVMDTVTDPRTAGATARALHAVGAAALLAVPVSDGSAVVGFLWGQDGAPRAWTTVDADFARQIADRGWIALCRARAVAALRDRETELYSALDTLPIAVALLDRTLRYSFANRAHLDWLQLPSEHILGRNLPDVVGNEPFLQRETDFGRALAGEPVAIRVDWPNPAGPARQGEMQLLPRRNAAGSVVGLIIIGAGMEEGGAAADTRHHGGQSLYDLGRLAGGLAHDLNDLLTGIIGSLQIVEVRLRQGREGEVTRHIAAAQAAAQRAAGLTDRLLAFSRRQAANRSPVNVSTLVAGMEGLIRRTVGPEVEVEAIGPDKPWLTLCDTNRLETALLSLAVNAREAMPHGGRLLIELSNIRLDASAAALRDMQPGEYVRLAVSDTGIGMSPEVKAQAFDPFFTTKPSGLKTGAGLSTIYGFVRESGGQARIHSQPGSGTTVTLLLPRFQDTDAVANDNGKVIDIPRAVAGESVLVVDDEDTVRELVAEMLEELGYAVGQASDSDAGLSILQSDARVDLLVTDFGLPGSMDGRQMADTARALRPDLRVLFITGHAETSVAPDGVLEPGLQVMTKPFAMDAMAVRVRTMLDR